MPSCDKSGELVVVGLLPRNLPNGDALVLMKLAPQYSLGLSPLPFPRSAAGVILTPQT